MGYSRYGSSISIELSPIGIGRDHMVYIVDKMRAKLIIDDVEIWHNYRDNVSIFNVRVDGIYWGEHDTAEQAVDFARGMVSGFCTALDYYDRFETIKKNYKERKEANESENEVE